MTIRGSRFLRDYATAAVAVALATVATLALQRWIGSSFSAFYFPAIIIVAVYGGYGPALFATLFSTVTRSYLIQPSASFDIGAEEYIRFIVFGVVGVATASLSSARNRAEAAQRKALEELQSAVNTLRKVSGWPVFGGASVAGGVRKLLEHAAGVVGAADALAVWEAEDEPWVYVALSSGPRDTVTKHPPTDLAQIVPPALDGASFVSAEPLRDRMTVAVRHRGTVGTWRGLPVHPDLAPHLRWRGIASAPFQVERLRGRMFFSGIEGATPELIPLVDVVAREVGHSIDQLYLRDRLQQLAVREDRIRVARDLHDGVLQSLTGIRFQLQSIAAEEDPSSAGDRLLAVERAIAIEQRELRMFIEDLKPVLRRSDTGSDVGRSLEELRARLAVEWQTPILLRVTPATLSMPATDEHALVLMVREAIVNAVKHAHPSRVAVDVHTHGADKLRVVISNDGRGFPFRGRLEHEDLAASHAGPVSLRERVVSVGGSLAIESTATGSRVEITLPSAAQPV